MTRMGLPSMRDRCSAAEQTIPVILLGLVLLRTTAQAQNASSPSSSSANSPTGIIATVGKKFVDKNCNEFVFSGANAWQVVEAAAGVDDGSASAVSQLFSTAKTAGINVLRFFPFGIEPSFTLETSPGVYNQQNWAALDSVIQQASAAGVKVILPFADNWRITGGKFQYIAWGSQSSDPDSFYTDDNVKQLYKNSIQGLVTHVNSLTGVAYMDDPTIFAWDLMNEMRSACDTGHPNVSCTATATQYMQAWVEEIAAYVKTVDPNHMLTVGEEGFYAASSPKAAQYNPGESFATDCGQDFLANHSPSAIDFAATHIWVDNWQVNSSFCGATSNPSCGPQFVTNWIQSHADDANSLNKPFVIEEFGNDNTWDPSERSPLYAAAYGAYQQALSNNSNLRGIAFWQWQYTSQFDGAASDAGYTVATGDSTWSAHIAPSFTATQSVLAEKKLVPNCVPGSTRAQSLSAGTVASAGRKLLATGA